MSEARSRERAVPLWLVLVVAIVALILASAALTIAFVGPNGFGMMGGFRVMNGSRVLPGSGFGTPGAAVPGQSGFVAGTASAPRVIRVYAGPGYAFTPSTIRVARGETVTFEVTTMGPLVHEFMVGPADAVAADTDGTPEAADIGMMQTKSVTVTFDGPGPYAYACHAAGHFEAGMRGTIVLD